MKRRKSPRWWGLYIVAPVSLGLLFVADGAPGHGETWHTVVSIGVAVLACGLAWLWSERNADLVGSQGVDAQAEEKVLSERGIRPGRLAPSLTARQAHYREVMPVFTYKAPDED
jgi:hypothetical protein